MDEYHNKLHVDLHRWLRGRPACHPCAQPCGRLVGFRRRRRHFDVHDVPSRVVVGRERGGVHLVPRRRTQSVAHGRELKQHLREPVAFAERDVEPIRVRDAARLAHAVPVVHAESLVERNPDAVDD